MAKRPKRPNRNNLAPAEATVELSPFEETVCQLKTPAAYPSRKIPATKERNSAFIDLDKQDATHADVFQALKLLTTISGVKYRRDLRVVEVIFVSEDERNKQVSESLTTPKNKTVFMNLPRHLVPKVTYVRLANLPLEGRDETLSAVKTYWSTYGEVMDAAPHTVKGTNWLTHRWDLLIQLPEDKDKLEAPVSFELLGRKIVAAWAGCPPSCLICLDAGHQAKTCPSKPPKGSKAGGRLDPEKRSARINTYAESLKKEPKSSHGSSNKPNKASTSAMHTKAHEQATGSNPSVSTSEPTAPVSEAMDSTPATPLNASAEAFTPQARPQTPPSQRILVVDPDTPRSESGKRQAKDELHWEMNPDFPEDVQKIIKHRGLCYRCGGSRPCSYCPKHSTIGKKQIKRRTIELLAMYLTPNGREQLDRIRRTTVITTGDKNSAEADILLDPFIEVPPFCSKCKTAGHLATVCPRANCNHCQSEEHIGVYCPERPQYAFGLEPIDADYSKPWH
jgi:hypothetical protein